MAVATLEECFNNPKVFTGVVKIRKGKSCFREISLHNTFSFPFPPICAGLTARLLLDSASIDGVHAWFYRFAKRISSRCPLDDPSRDKIIAATHAIVALTRARSSKVSPSSFKFAL